MKFVQYQLPDGSIHAGGLMDEGVYALNAPMLDIIAGKVQPELGALVPDANMVAPIKPGKLLCVGRNYAEHAAELNNPLPKKPLIFSKFPSCIIANGDTIQWHSSITQQVDWEGELVVVIGKTAKNIREEDAYEHIFGYTIANDVSARDLQDNDGQWTRAKGMDTFCPLGPSIVSKDDIPDPHALKIKTTVNGETMQDGNTSDMIFKVPFLVAYLSQTFTLEPGDLILTGTPSGVGKGMKPPRFLQSGDSVSVMIAGIGLLTNGCEVVG